MIRRIIDNQYTLCEAILHDDNRREQLKLVRKAAGECVKLLEDLEKEEKKEKEKA